MVSVFCLKCRTLFNSSKDLAVRRKINSSYVLFGAFHQRCASSLTSCSPMSTSSTVPPICLSFWATISIMRWSSGRFNTLLESLSIATQSRRAWKQTHTLTWTLRSLFCLFWKLWRGYSGDIQNLWWHLFKCSLISFSMWSTWPVQVISSLWSFLTSILKKNKKKVGYISFQRELSLL